MLEHIESLSNQLIDYRADENSPEVRISTERVEKWLNQFNQELRLPIAIELNHIFSQTYISKDRAKLFLRSLFKILIDKYNFSSEQEAIGHIEFVNLQPDGKSQGVLIKLIKEIIKESYQLEESFIGSLGVTHFIYLDDLLCTGLTYLNNIKDWLTTASNGKSNAQRIIDDSAKFLTVYFIVHEFQANKKLREIQFQNINNLSNPEKEKIISHLSDNFFRVMPIKETDILKPITTERKSILSYYNELENGYVKYASGKDYESKKQYYRDNNVTSELFSSQETRELLEFSLLEKGIEIINDTGVNHDAKFRALGFTLPSYRCFGFGALCATWRNVPNNAPLALWYKGGHFFPLFEKRQQFNRTPAPLRFFLR